MPTFVDATHGNYALSQGSIGEHAGTSITQRIAQAVNLPISQQDQPNMGRLNIDATQMPHGPVSGLWAPTKEPLNLGERDISYYAQEPMRWVYTNQQRYRISDHADDKPIVVELVSAQRSNSARYTISLTDSTGRELTRKQGPDTPGKALVILKVPDNATLPLLITLKDDALLDWRVTIPADNAILSIDASKPLALRKYDGGEYRFTYNATAQSNEPFAVTFTKRYSGDCMMTMTDPQSHRSTITSGQIIDPKGMPGVYTFDLTFTKKGEIQLQAADPYLGLPTNQPAATPKVQWGKPSF
jgi:hypothetical protein